MAKGYRVVGAGESFAWCARSNALEQLDWIAHLFASLLRRVFSVYFDYVLYLTLV